MVTFSIIIPVFNRPTELDELLNGLLAQAYKDFEVIVVEDGSSEKSDTIVEKYADRLTIKYFYKENSGPGQTRNYGSDRASGEYFIYFDSDCIIPEQYMSIVSQRLSTDKLDAYGGPDKAHDSFTVMQKAVNYAMTSFFTTGGIRGGKKALDVFFPRSFNMGLSRKVYEVTKGYSKMRFGEDIDLSARIVKAGFKTGLIIDAFVYHKRRASLRQFFKQVHNSGIARINLFKRHPEQLKLVHFLPAVFTLSVLFMLVGSLFCPFSLLPLLLFFVVVFFDNFTKDKRLSVAALAMLASFVQLFGYGTGFIKAFWKRLILKQDEFEAFKKNFYK